MNVEFECVGSSDCMLSLNMTNFDCVKVSGCEWYWVRVSKNLSDWVSLFEWELSVSMSDYEWVNDSVIVNDYNWLRLINCEFECELAIVSYCDCNCDYEWMSVSVTESSLSEWQGLSQNT